MRTFLTSAIKLPNKNKERETPNPPAGEGLRLIDLQMCNKWLTKIKLQLAGRTASNYTRTEIMINRLVISPLSLRHNAPLCRINDSIS